MLAIELQRYQPDEAKGQLGIAAHYVIAGDVHQLDPVLLNHGYHLVKIVDVVHPHPTLFGFLKGVEHRKYRITICSSKWSCLYSLHNFECEILNHFSKD